MPQIQEVKKFITSDKEEFTDKRMAEEHQDYINFSQYLAGFLVGKCEQHAIDIDEDKLKFLCGHITRDDIDNMLIGTKVS